MPGTSDPTGRRGNGLPAADWGALVDLDPRLSEGLLDRLAAQGVAAYVEPASAVDTAHRAVTLPDRPLDRLWVDPARAEQARDVVAREVADLSALLSEDEPGATAHGLVQPVPRHAARRVLPPPALPDPPLPDRGSAGALSDDEVFSQLVERFHADDDSTGPGGWPAAEEVPPPARRTHSVRPPAPAPAPDPPDPLPAWLEPEAVEDDGHYEPPPPPPVPRIRLRTLAALLAVVLGLLALFAPYLLGLAATSGVQLLGLASLAGGASALVWWMRDHADDGPDDGAVV